MTQLTEEEKALRIAAYNKVQIALAGLPIIPALTGLADALAVAVVQATNANRQAAHDLLDGLLPDMKRTADNNLDLMTEELTRNARLTSAGEA